MSIRAFANCLLAGLLSQGVDASLFTPAVVFSRRVPGPFKKWAGYLDKFWNGNRELRILRRREGANVVYHVLDQAGAIHLSTLANVPHLLTCNDLLAIRSARGEIREHRTGISGRILQKRILAGVRKAAYVACISENTRADLHRLAGISPARTRLIYMGLNFPYSPMPHEQSEPRLAKFGIRSLQPFLLHVGGNQWYKNRAHVVKAFAQLAQTNPQLTLVLAGKAPDPALTQVIDQTGLAARMVVAADCNNLELQALYSSALALLFPSSYEGFGWPIIEAQACGCPVITANRPPMTEAGGEAARYVDPESPEQCASVIQLLINDRTERAKMVEAGLGNASRFTTAKMIHRYIQFYTEIAANPIPAAR